MSLKGKNYGLYTAKTKGNDYACDSFGKAYTFNSTQAPFNDDRAETNGKWKGRQIISGRVDRDKTETGKIFKEAQAYAPEPYDDNPKVEKTRKKAFGSVSGTVA